MAGCSSVNVATFLCVSLLTLKGQFTPESNTHTSLFNDVCLLYNIIGWHLVFTQDNPQILVVSSVYRGTISSHRVTAQMEACIYSRITGELTKLVTLQLELRGKPITFTLLVVRSTSLSSVSGCTISFCPVMRLAGVVEGSAVIDAEFFKEGQLVQLYSLEGTHHYSWYLQNTTIHTKTT